MANRTNTSAPYYSYEYYLDYLDLMPVDEKKLRANKHSIVIAFWVSLAAFVVFLFLILLYMSWSGSPQTSLGGGGWGALFLLAPSPPVASTVSHPSGLHTPGHPGPPRSHVGGRDQLWSNEET
ncbi:hypothetical protein FD755_022017 [Muntiacus reevesi]|uniref:Melanocortin-2 receptor accessory protein n=1 Tax=Muntiacus reevesi TaxID=9886 RepID=A0A5N3W1T1_MUNRE|nr:hypothetical protein FD755_022017 [Muntiacus reevesi]